MGPLPWVTILVMVLVVLGISTTILYYEMSLKSLGGRRQSGVQAEWVW